MTAVFRKEEHFDNIGTMLNNIRVEEKITQEKLAALMKMGQSQVSHIESNRKIPTFKTVMRYLKACGYQIVFEKRKSNP